VFIPRSTSLYENPGELAGVVGMIVDVSVQKQSEHAARHYSAIIESSNDAIVSKDMNGIIQTWNRAAERMFGYAAEEIIGKSILTLIPEERHHEEHAILGKIGARNDRLALQRL